MFSPVHLFNTSGSLFSYISQADCPVAVYPVSGLIYLFILRILVNGNHCISLPYFFNKYPALTTLRMCAPGK